MREIAGVFNGTGATLYFCLGFIPDWVHLRNHETGNDYEIEWNINMMRCTEYVEGISTVTAGGTYRDMTALTKGTGILPNYGKTVLTTTTAGTTTYGEGVYLKYDNRDYRYLSTESPHGLGDATENNIDTWTLTDGSTNKGTFGTAGATGGTYIGEGSEICIDGRWYAIVAFTSDGGDADDITLSHKVGSGKIDFIGGMYSFAPMIAKEMTSDGFVLTNTSVNVNNALCSFVAGKYDW